MLLVGVSVYMKRKVLFHSPFALDGQVCLYGIFEASYFLETFVTLCQVNKHC